MDLFVRRIDLSFRAREKEIVSTREERIEIFLRLEVETVKSPKFVKQAAPDDEHVFLGGLHPHCHSERSEESLIICLSCAPSAVQRCFARLNMTKAR